MNRAEVIEKQIVEWTGKREKLEQRRAGSGERIAKLEEQRRLCLVGAHTGDAGAQKELQRVNGEIEAAARDASDVADAIEQVDGKIRELEAASKAAAREKQREALCSLIQGRITEQREQRIVVLLRGLEAELILMESSTNEIARGLRAFDRRLESQTQHLQGRESLPVENLRGYGLRSLKAFEQYATSTPDFWARLLRHIDRVSVEEEVAASAGA
jgi:chromosome segregation ATPase